MSEKSESKPKSLPANTSEWFVRMSNGSIFGPINTKGLVYWACDGRILPDDEISPDRVEWRPARDLAELKMDTMIERPDGTFMGPFNAKAIEPLVREGKIPPRSKPFPVGELDSRMAARQMALFGDDAVEAPSADPLGVDDAVSLPDDAAWIREACDAQIEAIRREAADRIAEWVRTNETLEAERDALTARLAAAPTQETVDTLQARLAALEAAREAPSTRADDTLKARLSSVEAERDALKARLAKAPTLKTVDTLTAAVAALEAERDALKNAVETESASLVAANERLVQLEAEKRRAVADALARSQELQEEYNELLAFSNARDGAMKDQVRQLHAELAQLKDAALGRGLVPIRRLEDVESRLSEAIRDRDALRDQLAAAGAKHALSGQVTEGDIAIIKTFAVGALDLMQKTLEQERERNTVARAASAELQGTIHTEIERLQRVLARDPGERSRSEQMEQRSEHQIAKLQQEIDAVRRHHQADMARAEANEKALEGRCKALIQKEALLRDKLSRVEQRTAEYDSLSSQLRRKEGALLAAEKEFEEARQQWQIIGATLQHRIDELERGAGMLFDGNEASRQPEADTASGELDSRGFRVEPWMRRMKRN